METNDSSRRSLEARLDELDRHMDEIAEKAHRISAHAETPMQSQLHELRERSSTIRRRLREKAEADDRESDAALRELGRALNEMYAELGNWPQ